MDYELVVKPLSQDGYEAKYRELGDSCTGYGTTEFEAIEALKKSTLITIKYWNDNNIPVPVPFNKRYTNLVIFSEDDAKPIDAESVESRCIKMFGKKNWEIISKALPWKDQGDGFEIQFEVEIYKSYPGNSRIDVVLPSWD